MPKLIEAGGSWCVDLPYRPKDAARKPYAIRNAQREGGGRVFVKLHRYLMDAPDGAVVDHINGNTLDNRKANLRITDQFANAQNVQGPSRNNKSGALNVSFCESSGLYHISVMRRGREMRAKRKDFSEAVEVASSMREGMWRPRKRGNPKLCS